MCLIKRQISLYMSGCRNILQSSHVTITFYQHMPNITVNENGVLTKSQESELVGSSVPSKVSTEFNKTRIMT
jgi:hypothetical protein